MIKFNKPSITDKERQNVIEAMNGNNILSGDGKFTMQVYKQFEERFGIKNMLHFLLRSTHFYYEGQIRCSVTFEKILSILMKD